MSSASVQIDEKSWLDIVTILPRVLPPIIEAVTKSQADPKSIFPCGPNLPWLNKSAATQDPEKFWNILIPVLTSVVPAVVDAVTKGAGLSLGGGLSTPFGGATLGGSVQIGKDAAPADQKIWGDLIRVLLPPLINAVTKAPQTAAPVSAGTVDNQKFLELLPIILPAIISAVSR